MLARMFGIFGIILGAAYLLEGVIIAGILNFVRTRGSQEMFVSKSLFVTWDFLFGISLIVAAIGVLLLRNWGRMMWLGLMPALVFVHFGIIAYNQTFRHGSSQDYYLWTIMVVLATALSCWYLTRPGIRERFLSHAQESTT